MIRRKPEAKTKTVVGNGFGISSNPTFQINPREWFPEFNRQEACRGHKVWIMARISRLATMANAWAGHFFPDLGITIAVASKRGENQA
jgi:hypothetical protein